MMSGVGSSGRDLEMSAARTAPNEYTFRWPESCQNWRQGSLAGSDKNVHPSRSEKFCFSRHIVAISSWSVNVRMREQSAMNHDASLTLEISAYAWQVNDTINTELAKLFPVADSWELLPLSASLIVNSSRITHTINFETKGFSVKILTRGGESAYELWALEYTSTNNNLMSCSDCLRLQVRLPFEITCDG